MTVKVSDVMRQVRNHFVCSAVTGEWAHTGGVLSPAEDFAPGMWIAVTGRDAPCGVFRLDENGGIPGLGDVSWTGVIFRLNPPADFLRLCEDIAAWAAANPDPSVTGEKLGAYSVTRSARSWETVFAPALAPYRRMFTEVEA